VLTSKGTRYLSKSEISDKENLLNKYKVIITYAMSGGNKPGTDGQYQIISSLKVLGPNEACTETYLILGTFDTLEESENLVSYASTKFFRFLLLQALTSIHITKDKFCFVPLQDFTESWTDEKLYQKYQLTEDEIAFIESMIRPME
jgi:site-specific DNA-methyltransferase (adenine-specific)